jgi:lysophospholipase L1-like esterase/uncharacterized protein YraI
MRLLIVAIIVGLFQFGNFASAAQAVNGRVASEDIPLNLRAGPGLDFAVLDMLPDGTELVITGRSEDAEWLEVRTQDDLLTGWVFAEYVTVFTDLDHLPMTSGPLSFTNLITGITDHAHDIYQRGQTLGNRPDVFAKVGDSITVSNHMLHPIGEGHYDLDEYNYLQPVIDYFSHESVRQGNAFTNTSVAAGVGWNAAAVLLPKFADPSQCQADESPLACEYRIIQPAWALIMFGTNDVGYVPEVDFQHNLERIVQISTDMGVVPVLSTIPPRVGYEEAVVRFNQIVREVARENAIPLWDYHYAMAAYAETSLTFDGVHPSMPARGHDDVAIFREANLPYGYVLRNLSALHVLDALWHEIVLEDRS